jgi:hypothetical protein
MTKPRHHDIEEFTFKGHEVLPSINTAQTVADLIAERGIPAAAEHAAAAVRFANALKNYDTAADWDAVYRLILARRA